MDVKAVKSAIGRAVVALEDKSIPFINYLYLFLGIMLLKVFLSAFSQEINQFDLPSLMMKESTLHMLTAYSALIMLIALFVYYSTDVSIGAIFRVFIPMMLILLFAPVWDLFFAGDEGVALLYMQPGQHLNILKTWLTFFGGFHGISTGVRIEIAMFLAMSFLYFRYKSCGMLHSVLLTVGLYTLIFVWGGAPFLVKLLLHAFGFAYHYSNESMIRFFLIFDFVLLASVTALYDKDFYATLSDNLRLDNLFYYQLTLVFGASIAFSLQYSSFSSYMRMYPPVAINELLAMIAVLFAYLFATCINPNQVGKEKDARTLAYTFLWLSLVYAAMISAHALIIVGALLASFFIYNVAPIHLKRFLLISKLPIGFQSFAVLFLGFVLVQHGTYEFPGLLGWIYLLGITLAANVLDLDPMLTSNNTLPAVLGEKKAKLLIGFTFLLLMLSFYFVFRNIWLLPILGSVGLGFFYLTNQRHYDAWKLKLLGNISLAVASVYLLTSWTS